MSSLQVRIVAAIVLVCVVTVAAVASYVARTTLLIRMELPAHANASAVSAGVVPLLRAGSTRPMLQSALANLGEKYGVRIVLVNVRSHAAVASFGAFSRADLQQQADGSLRATLHEPRHILMLRGGTPLTGATAWRLFVLPATPALDALAPVRASVLSAVWASAIVGLGGALLVALWLGSYIVRPIRELTSAARAMSRGDVSRRVASRANGEIGQLAASFNAMAQAVETTEGLRRQMVTDVAHELRSPLTRMIARLEAATDGHLSATEAIAGAREDALRLERVIDDLRDLSLADSHELLIARNPIAVADAIDRACERMAREAQRARVVLERNVQANLPSAVGDELRIAQILDNLIGNALRYTPAGGRVVVGATLRSNRIECFVADNGIGISPERQPLVFERFYRADASRSRNTGGSGLGLAIVKALVEALGGTVAVESRPYEGSRFSWTLPLAFLLFCGLWTDATAALTCQQCIGYDTFSSPMVASFAARLGSSAACEQTA